MNYLKMMNLKIFLSYHRCAPLFKSSVLVPIHAGRSLLNETKDGEISIHDHAWLCSNLIGDNTGDNISHLNREFCETTVLYWMWKQIDQFGPLDFIGFMQYRRHFIFHQHLFDNHKNDIEKKGYGCIHMRLRSQKKYIKKIGLEKNVVISCLTAGYCGVLPVPGNLAVCGVSSLWDDYVRRIPGVHINDLFTLVDVIQSIDSFIAKKLLEYLDQPVKLMYHMFVLSRAEFMEYCNFLFPMLFKIQSSIDTSFYTANGKRTLGYLAEILFGLYFLKLSGNNYQHLGVTYLEGI